MDFNERILEGFIREMEKLAIDGAQMRTSVSPTMPMPNIASRTPVAPLPTPMLQSRKPVLPPTSFSRRPPGVMGMGTASRTSGQFGRIG